jgi:hypothetical protein
LLGNRTSQNRIKHCSYAAMQRVGELDWPITWMSWDAARKRWSCQYRRTLLLVVRSNTGLHGKKIQGQDCTIAPAASTADASLDKLCRIFWREAREC